MSASRALPMFSVLLSIPGDIKCCKMLGLIRRFNTVVEKSIFLKTDQPMSDILRVYNLMSLSKNVRYLSSTRLRSDSNEPISKPQAEDLVLRLTENERNYLLTALQEFEANKVKAEYEGQLAAARWRSRYGRPSKLPTLGDVDPTGTYCHLSDDWLKKKYALIRYTHIVKRTDWVPVEYDTENVPPPSLNQLAHVGIHNAIPFIGFGFLDNFIMIIAGDYIELSLGAVITISTMAAAALGNTISDVLGIGSAWYIEMVAMKIGLKAPNLSPVQLDMKSARRFANLGRAIGITVGCLLGMVPLLFMNTSKESKEDAKENKN